MQVQLPGYALALPGLAMATCFDHTPTAFQCRFEDSINYTLPANVTRAFSAAHNQGLAVEAWIYIEVVQGE